MACTTILVGKDASYDGSTIIARNEDSANGEFCPKRFIVVKPEEQPRRYRSVLSHVEIDLPDERYSPHQIAERNEMHQAIWDGLNALPPNYRQVLILREMDGFSYVEIAELLGIEVGTVKSRIARARLALRNILLEQGVFFSQEMSAAASK